MAYVCVEVMDYDEARAHLATVGPYEF